MTDQKHTKELLPCPFCGSTAIHLQSNGPGHTGSMQKHGIWCGGCRAATNWSVCKLEAIKHWNTRHENPLDLRRQRDELREALQFWLPNSIPFPDPDNDEACKRCNKRWEEHLTLLTKTKESV